jgi:Flp pilus assembly pilin Flp
MFQTAALRLLVTWQQLRARLEDDEGQTLAEYGLIMAVIAVAVIVLAGVAFRSAIIGSFEDSTNCLDGVASCAY